MKRRRTRLLAALAAPLLLAALASGFVAANAPRPPLAPRSPLGERCSLVPLPFGQAPVATYFVGTALPDTVAAGPGPVEVHRAGGVGSAPGAAVHGQLVRVDTLGGARADWIHRWLDWRRSREVVVVPWAYDAACRPVPWDASARWTEPGLVGFYTVALRPESLWVDRRPTFDAYAADLDPYPHARYYRSGARGTDQLRTRASLDAHEMFALYDALPPHGRRDAAALARLRAWADANPELARKYPADVILREATRREGVRRKE